MRRPLLLLAVVLLLGACASPAGPPGADFGTFDPDGFRRRLAESSRPTVVNVWASWCVPCRSEAPLLAAAHARYGDRVDFVGIDVEDSPAAAAAFVAEFGLTFEQLSDPAGEVRDLLGVPGTPATYFVASGGEIVRTHAGVVDEAGLALGVDELLRR